MSCLDIQAILFDLDDTLYAEVDFFRSGFSAVGGYLEARGIGNRQATADLLLQMHQREGREHVFQKLAQRLEFSTELILGLVQHFRAHEPRIVLASDAVEALPELKTRYRLGCVTDGWAGVQRSKIAALGVAPMLDALIVADDLGRQFWKPDPLPFQICCEKLQVSVAAAVFVGDNPERDMAGARRAGLRCVRIRRESGYYSHVECESPDLRPDAEIKNLLQLESVLDMLSTGPVGKVAAFESS